MFQLGTDVSKKTLSLCLLREGVEGSVRTRELQNDTNTINAVIAWLSRQCCKLEDVHVIMEATGVYYESLAYGPRKAGDRISFASPHRAREFIQGMGMLIKNDRVDAYVLACCGVPKVSGSWFPPPEEVRHLSALLRRRDALVADSTREKNRLEKYLAINAPSTIAESVEAMVGQPDAEIKRLDRLIRSHLNQYPELRKNFDLLTSIRFVDYQLGLNILIILRSHDFTTAKQATAFLGVVPVEKYPGTSVRGYPKLLKIGPSEIRVRLYLASLCGPRFNPSVKTMYE